MRQLSMLLIELEYKRGPDNIYFHKRHLCMQIYIIFTYLLRVSELVVSKFLEEIQKLTYYATCLYTIDIEQS